MIINELSKCGIVPVIKLTEIEKAEKLAEALLKGGINCAEITFRADNAQIAISKMLDKYPDMIIGAGTVLNIKEAREAIDAGAKFIVSPGFDERVVHYAVEQNVLVVPGCITPTEIQKAIQMKLNLVKFFPAEQFGGIQTIKALSAPFSQVKFMPTGGISLKNLSDYMKVESILACGGTFMVKEEIILMSQWETVTELSRQAVDIVKHIRK